MGVELELTVCWGGGVGVGVDLGFEGGAEGLEESFGLKCC
jgi:hypothetical protein